MTKYRVMWRKRTGRKKRYSVAYTDRDEAERMADSITNGGDYVYKIEELKTEKETEK